MIKSKPNFLDTLGIESATLRLIEKGIKQMCCRVPRVKKELRKKLQRRAAPHFDPFTCNKNVTGHMRSWRGGGGDAYVVLVSSSRDGVLWEVKA
jgi:hypothetical protein